MKRIVAICGEKRSGKDVLAKHLVEKYGCIQISFAQHLKDIVKLIFNFTDGQLGIGGCNDYDKDVVDDKWGISPRKAMQFFGTEVLQDKIQELIPNIGRDYFANNLLSKMNNDEKYVISDLRFLHEYEKIKHLDILIVRVSRPFTNDESLVKHVSETEFLDIPFDLNIMNDYTINEMYKQFDDFIN
jgi:dephospho-CoA kinase